MSDFFSAFPQTLHSHHLHTLTTFLDSTATELTKSSLLDFLKHNVTKIDLLFTHQSSFNPVQTAFSQTDYHINLQQKRILSTLNLLVNTISSNIESLSIPSFPHVVEFHQLFKSISASCRSLTCLTVHYHPEHYKERFNVVLQNRSYLKQLRIIAPDEDVLAAIAKASTTIENLQLYDIPHNSLHLIPEILEQNLESLESFTIHVEHHDHHCPFPHKNQLKNEQRFLKSLLSRKFRFDCLSRLCLLLSKETIHPDSECFKLFQKAYTRNSELQFGSNDMQLIRSLKPTRKGSCSDLILQISQQCPLFSHIRIHTSKLHKLHKLDLSSFDFFDKYCQSESFKRNIRIALEGSNRSLQHINMQRTPNFNYGLTQFMQFMVLLFNTSHKPFTLSCSTLFISALVKASVFPETEKIWNRLIPRLSCVQKIHLHGLPHCANPSQCWDCALQSLTFLDNFTRFLTSVVPHMESLRVITLSNPVKITDGEHKTNFQCCLRQVVRSVVDFDQHTHNVDLSVLDTQLQLWLLELDQ
ncbi:hypothetical protein BWQ96_07020 [Gracilariopsis chorda]|uniref:Uncharacterized protein n=1 Tax=Gracilariopsis chorda TaxID=448386 RepID=A0A2V3IMG9_9FLOR|nr:hypothetical protein BWQ96_07020 [Gracilariopsis chorda]|eukprot:PXF43247.1 hypothetical protein BWQ96_07020 [Gracilariopsis chorda]